MIPIFIIDKAINRSTNCIHRKKGFDYKRQTPNGDGKWNDIVLVDHPTKAKFIISLDEAFTDPGYKIQEKKYIYLARENKESKQALARHMHLIPPSSRNRVFLLGEKGHISPTIWAIDKSWKELNESEFPKKTKKMSAIVSNIKVMHGHRMRLKVLFALMSDGYRFDYFGEMKPKNIGVQGLDKFPQYKGKINDKWKGLAPYEYTLAFGNVEEKDYMTEKLVDAILAGCIPIYWECPNVHEYLPVKSFLWLSVPQTKWAVEQIQHFVKVGNREERLEDLRKAKRLILDKYHFWPVVENAIKHVLTN